MLTSTNNNQEIKKIDKSNHILNQNDHLNFILPQKKININNDIQKSKNLRHSSSNESYSNNDFE